MAILLLARRSLPNRLFRSPMRSKALISSFSSSFLRQSFRARASLRSLLSIAALFFGQALSFPALSNLL